ncbi:MAG TPA: hypothetical protein VGO92_11215 [Acidimicrobiales bacterium]|nr:hypothetical protein [Acidimicrobiales bacterium]
MKRLVALAGGAALAASFLLAPSAPAAPGTPEGCILSNPGPGAFPSPGQNVGGTSCTYSPTVTGTWGGVGDFTVTVWQDDTMKVQLYSVHNTAGPAQSSDAQAIPAGSFVVASVNAAGSGLAVGNATGA